MIGLIKKLTILLVAGVLAAPVYAVSLTPATVTPSGQTVIVPQVAIDQAPPLEYITIIHFKRGFGHKPQHNPGGGTEEPISATCYGFISKGAKLTSTENLAVNSAGSGILDTDILNGTQSSATEWDSHTGTSLFGTTTLSATANFDPGNSPDGVNELSFGNYPTAGVIAVTRIWGIFSGPPSIRFIDQFDILFDTDFTWGDATLNSTLMDYKNIATHEIGHGTGLADVYDSPCIDVTMFGLSDNGETKKRDLAPPDITGLQKLYGI